MKKKTQQEIADIIGLVLAKTGQNLSEREIQKAEKDKDIGRVIFWGIVQGAGETTEDVINTRRRDRRYGYGNH